jgi:hypothetical protein
MGLSSTKADNGSNTRVMSTTDGWESIAAENQGFADCPLPFDKPGTIEDPSVTDLYVPLPKMRRGYLPKPIVFVPLSNLADTTPAIQVPTFQIDCDQIE